MSSLRVPEGPRRDRLGVSQFPSHHQTRSSRLGHVNRGTKLSVEPSLSDSPATLHRRRRDAKGRSGLLDGHATEKPAFYDAALSVTSFGQASERLVELEDGLRTPRGIDGRLPHLVQARQRFSLETTASLLRLLIAGVVDQDMPNGSARGREKMGLGFEVGRRLGDELEVRFVDERGRIERLVATPLPSLSMRQRSEFLIDEREELIIRLPSSGPQVAEETSDRLSIGVRH